MAGQFELELKSRAKMTNERAALIMRKIGFGLYRKIVMKTPVDTGLARGNWQASINSPIIDAIKRKSQGTSNIERDKMREYKAGDTIFIVNNLDYIQALENGHSTQAPSGMVRITTMEFAGVAESAVRAAKSEIKP